jgi:tetratricopeptide (TPR) repeat protein
MNSEKGITPGLLIIFILFTMIDIQLGLSAKNTKQEGYKFANYGESQKAFDCFDSAVKEDPFDTEALKNRGNLYLMMGKSDEALADFLQAQQIDGSDSLVYLSRNKWEEALEYANKSLTLDKDDNDLAYSLRSFIYYKTEQYDKAIEDCNKLTSLEKNPTSYLTRGASYQKQGKFEIAMEDYLSAIKLKPDWLQPHYCLARCCEQNGDLLKASEYYKKSAQLLENDSLIDSYDPQIIENIKKKTSKSDT